MMTTQILSWNRTLVRHSTPVLSVQGGLVSSWLAERVRLSAVNISTVDYSKILRDSICEFQAKYIEYHVNTAQAHRAFKEAYKNNSKDTEQKYQQLLKQSEQGFKSLSGKHAKWISGFFIKTREHYTPPRVGIHFIDENEDIRDVVVTVRKDRDDYDTNSAKSKDRYTIFNHIFNTCKPYSSNNIPRTIFENPDYKHDGLDLEGIRNDYKLRKIKDSKVLSRFRNNWNKKPESVVDKEWNKFTNGNLRDPERGLYKSHIGVPITFNYHIETYELDRDILPLTEKFWKTAHGFIVVDHPAAYYFDDKHSNKKNENIDINALYVFADLLSLVFITSIMYTEASSTCKAFRENLNQ
ncbi:MAG: hypothetical protein WD607_11390 [Candidatus Paceibacterota bacterium]